MRETIFLAVCNALGIDYKEAATTSRMREYVIARQMYIALVKEQIGSMALFEHKFGHAVVWHHLKKFKDEINQPFMEDVKLIYEELLTKFKTKN